MNPIFVEQGSEVSKWGAACGERRGYYWSLQVTVCQEIHSSVSISSTRFLHELSRHNYVTPTSYLQLLAIFSSLVDTKKHEVATARDRTKTGLDKVPTLLYPLPLFVLYVFITKEVMLPLIPRVLFYRRRLSVGLSLSNSVQTLQTDLHEIFREDWQWVSEQMVRFWWPSGSPSRYRDCFLDWSLLGDTEWLTGIHSY